MLTSLVFTAWLAGLVACSPLRTRSPYVVKEVHNPPNRWAKVGAAPADHIVNLQIGLKQNQFDELERHLHEGKLHFSHGAPINGFQFLILITIGMANTYQSSR